MTVKEQIELLKRGAVELVSEEELEQKLSSGRPLRVKLGVDPTSPDLHLGHTVVLSKLRLFQDLGHKAVLIIGDFTARIGDPSGRDQTRPAITPEQIEKNARTYKEQAFKVLDPAKTEMRSNSEWLEPFVREQVFSVLQKYTVSQLLQREDFALRTEKGLPITLLEILYPVFQGYDSVAVKADVELGGNDQLFNLLFGRQMQKDFGQSPQAILTLPLLRGTDGVKKMSKTYQNAVALEDPPKDMFGKVMSLPDDLMLEFYELLTREDMEKVKKEHPKKAKLRLAELLTSQYHGEKAAKEELERFEKVFSQKELPEDIPVHHLKDSSVNIVELLVESGLAPSKNEARRLLSQGGVRLNDQVLAADRAAVEISRESILRVGRRRFLKIIPAGKDR